MKKGYYLNDKRTNYSTFRYYLYKLCKLLVLESLDSANELKWFEDLTIEKMNYYFDKMKNEDIEIEGKKLKFRIIQ